jgi:phosphonatase-like hydrolase
VIARFVAEKLSVEETRVITLSEQIFDTFRRVLVKKYTDRGIGVVPGAVDTFAWLHDKGIKVALNTGFDRAITEIILESLGWQKHTFDAVVCGEDVPRGRPAPYMIFRAMEAATVISVHRVACVGDTALDLQAGWNAAVHWNIGVLSGAHGREQLERARHTHILPSVAALPSLWH